jgi:hypothetical protein
MDETKGWDSNYDGMKALTWIFQTEFIENKNETLDGINKDQQHE